MKRLILLALMTLAAALAAQADIIYVQGDVSGTWAADTVIVTGEVRVPPGQTLVIEPGVKVLFQVYCMMVVDTGSALRAEGTAQDTIIFKPLAPNASWKGIQFQSSSDISMLEYCHLANGKTSGATTVQNGGGIRCYNTHLTIENCLIDSCFSRLSGSGGAIYCSNSDLVLMNCLIRNNRSGSGGYGGSGAGIGAAQSDLHIERSEFIENVSNGGCGAIYCNRSNAMITQNVFQENSCIYHGGAIALIDSSYGEIVANIFIQNSTNSVNSRGGAISCTESNAVIAKNVIYGDGAYYGGGIALDQSNSLVQHNIILGNSAVAGGGIHCQEYSNSVITENVIKSNESSFGGGIHLDHIYADFLFSIKENSLVLNNGDYSGGAFECFNSSFSYLSIILNVIYKNSNGTYGFGGGFGFFWVDGSVYSNTIYGNQSLNGGAIAHLSSSNIAFRNSVMWANGGSAQPLIDLETPASSVEVGYTDIQYGWLGIGNLDQYPAFVDTLHDDYRLVWGSPCIDAGDPNPIHDDPDSTRADMGAFYYDQSTPVRILLTPHETPYLISDSGGTMTYTLRLDTHLEEPQVATFWCDVTLPDSSILGPLLGPATVDVLPNQMVSWVRYQGVPGTAPLGVSHYNAYAVVNGDTSKDSFMFGVMGFGSEIQDPWENWGDPLGVPPQPLVRPGIPDKFALHPPHPNPFNATTVASYELRVASEVSLRVYDTAGKLVQTLVKGWMSAGFHEAVFDGRDWPSGIYIYRLQAGDFVAVQKMVLIK